MDESDSNKLRLPPEIEEQLKDLPSLLNSDDFGLSQIFDSKSSFYEKLILLNSGTLTLLFTVVGGLAGQVRQNKVQPLGVHHFTTGCWLLIASTVACLVHNHFTINTMVHIFGARVQAADHFRLSRLHEALVRHGYNSPLEAELEKLSRGNAKAKKYGALLERLCSGAGLTAQVLTIIAFVELVIFMNSNLSALL